MAMGNFLKIKQVTKIKNKLLRNKTNGISGA
jgi:hypothetical protein